MTPRYEPPEYPRKGPELRAPLKTTLVVICLAFLSCHQAFGQIGGHSFGDGPFLLEDVEDLDLVADPLGRNWVPDFNGNKPILSAIDLASSTLTLHPEQSPMGAFKAVPKPKAGFVNQGFGVPTPSQPGESTLDFPGDISAFPALNFLACHQENGLEDAKFQVLLECYPQNDSGSFPTIIWNYTPARGIDFQPVSIPLSAPAAIIHNDESLSLQSLLSKTRFLFFFFFAAAGGLEPGLEFHIDDIELGDDLNEPSSSSNVDHWVIYE